MIKLTEEQKANIARLSRIEQETLTFMEAEEKRIAALNGAKPIFEYTIEGDKNGKVYRTRRIDWNDILD